MNSQTRETCSPSKKGLNHMCSNQDVEHLFQATTEAQTCTFHTDTTLDGNECEMCILDEQNAGPRPAAPGMSPWVKRNLDYAQYSKPRNSQYEG